MGVTVGGLLVRKNVDTPDWSAIVGAREWREAVLRRVGPEVEEEIVTSWPKDRSQLSYDQFLMIRDPETALPSLICYEAKSPSEDNRRALLKNTGVPAHIRARWALEWGVTLLDD